MANITLSIPEYIRAEMNNYSEIKWSEVAKNSILEKLVEIRKLQILRKYLEKEPFSASDLEWMDKQDWHPVDERPMKKSFIKSLHASRKEKSTPTTVDALFR